MLLGLMGKKRSGKDTIADYLVNNYNFFKLGYADKLKRTVIDLWDLSEWQVYTQEGKESLDVRYGLTSREMQQKLGDAVREIFPNTWIYHLIKKMNELKRNPLLKAENFVISDVRRINEFNTIKEHKGIIIKIIREDIQNTDFHKSEIEMDSISNDQFDGIITAKTGEISKLYNGIEQVIFNNKFRR